MPANAPVEPHLRVVDEVENAEGIGADVAPTAPIAEPQQQPQQPAVMPQVTSPSATLLKQIAFEAALFGVGGATAGVLSANARKRPKGALLGSMGSVGVYGLYRASIGGKYLPIIHRAALGVLGVALLAGSGYLAFFHTPKPSRALAGVRKGSNSSKKVPKKSTKRRARLSEED